MLKEVSKKDAKIFSVANHSRIASEIIKKFSFVGLTMFLSVTVPLERANSMNEQPIASEQNTIVNVTPYWSSLTDPRGNEFELPSGIAKCSVLKVTIGKIRFVDSRLGRYATGGTFTVDDNMGNIQHSLGQIVDANLYMEYEGTPVGLPLSERSVGPMTRRFFHKNDRNKILYITIRLDLIYDSLKCYVCIFNSGGADYLSYFLK